MDQIELHKKIDSLLLQEPSKTEREAVSVLISSNADAREYFYTKANGKWLGWLWEKGFLNEIKLVTTDPKKRNYRIPELIYLGKVADENASEVVQIMLQVPEKVDAFNPDVVDKFLWICSKLSADQLAIVVPKIHEENWVRLMQFYNDPGFEYEKILATLHRAGDYPNLILLSETILSVRKKDEVEKSSNHISTDNPFCMNDLTYTKVFEHLVSVDDKNLENALAVVTNIMSEVVLLGGKNTEDRIFPIAETFHLYDVDFFTLELGQKEHFSHREDVRELAALLKTFFKRIIGEECNDNKRSREIYDRYVKAFPESRSLWRLRLYIISLCPSIFSLEIKEEIFRIFKYETPGDLLSGAEYERLLQVGFGVLSNDDQRAYISKVIEWFSKSKWPQSGRDLLSCVVSHMTSDEKSRSEEALGKLIQDYKPEPSIIRGHAGTVVSQPPPNADAEWEKPIPQVIELLKGEWAPNVLREKYKKSEDFLRPIDAEGVAERLKSEMAVRQQEFIDNALLFFDRSKIDPHYTYAFLQGLYNLIREKKIVAGVNMSGALKLMSAVAASAGEKVFEEKPDDRKDYWGWLAHWDAVHNAMADLLKEMLGGGEPPVVDFKQNREIILGLISYLLGHHDPSLKDEELETAKFKTTSGGSANYMVGDPFTTAINSVRGRAFEALVNFAYRDAQGLPKEQASKIASDVKDIYKDTLQKEETRALAFMFGHYLPPFYFRDREWVRSLLPQIFPTADEKKYFYLAAWEGYLANNLYEEMFFDDPIQQLYKRSITSEDTEDLSRKHFKDPDEGLAVHIGLAFMYYPKFDFTHPLFKLFWENHPERQGEFVSFLGRMFVSGDNANAKKLLKEEQRAVKRLRDFWDWALTNYQNRELFVEFGFWINSEQGWFEIPWLAERTKKTLEKTDGFLDWDYGLLRSIIPIAKEAPEDALAIAKLHLLEGGIRAKQDERRMPLHIDNEWFDAFKILYSSAATKEGTYSLINDLIKEGGGAFWKLKEIL